MTIGDFANWVQIIWGPSALVATLWAVYKAAKKQEKKREIEMALLQNDVTAIIQRMNREFNGNSGGIRQSINAMDKKIDKIETRLDQESQDLATLTGRFDEHTD